MRSCGENYGDKSPHCKKDGSLKISFSASGLGPTETVLRQRQGTNSLPGYRKDRVADSGQKWRQSGFAHACGREFCLEEVRLDFCGRF